MPELRTIDHSQFHNSVGSQESIDNHINDLNNPHQTATGGDAGGISGGIECIIGQTTYTIYHDHNEEPPVVSLIIPSNGAALSIAGVYNVTTTHFSVVLSQSPQEEGYYISWYRNNQGSGGVGNGSGGTFHPPATPGAGIAVCGQEVINTDRGSLAVSRHEAMYNHEGMNNLSWRLYTQNKTGIAGNGYAMDTRVESLTVSLPKYPRIGEMVGFRDAFGTAQINPIHIFHNSNKISGLYEDVNFDIPYGVVIYTFLGEERGWDKIGLIRSFGRIEGSICEGNDGRLLSWGLYNTNITAVSGFGYAMDTRAESRNISFPTNPKIGDNIGIRDAFGTSDTNNIILLPNGNRIGGVVDSVIFNIPLGVIIFSFLGGERGWDQVSILSFPKINSPFSERC